MSTPPRASTPTPPPRPPTRPAIVAAPQAKPATAQAVAEVRQAAKHRAKSFHLSPGLGNPWPLFANQFRNILSFRLKTLLLFLLLLIPVAITFIIASETDQFADYGHNDFWGKPSDSDLANKGLLWFQDSSYGILFPFLIPLTVAFFATGVIQEEVDGKTLPYIFMRPVYRNWLVIPKILGTMAAVYLLSLAALTILWFSAVSFTSNPFHGLHELLGHWAVAGLAILATGGLFLFVGTLMRRGAIVVGLYLFLWELGLSNVPLGLVQKLTIVYYERGILLAVTGRDLSFADDQVSPVSAVAGIFVLLLLGISGVLSALYVVSNKDYNV